VNIRRTIPPAASPLSLRDFLRGMYGILDGRFVGEIEEELRKYFDTGHVFLVSSGKAALALIFSGLHSMTGRTKVIIPAYTCYSVPSAVIKAGLEIVLCDVNPETLDFDYEFLEGLADRETLCVVSTHLFGIPSDVSRVRALTEGKGIFIVEDAAQGMGVQTTQKKLGTLGDAGFFSLGRGKNITCGAGGIILTSSDDVARSISSLYVNLERETIPRYALNILEVLLMIFFIHPRVYWFPRGLPFLGIGETRFDPHFSIYRMNGFKAGLLRSWRYRLETSNRYRTDVAGSYMKELRLGNGKPIYSSNIPFLRFPFYGEGHTWKEDVCCRYGHLGISPMYPDSINNIGVLRGTVGEGPFTGAERIVKSMVTLPTHSYLNGIDKSRICTILKSRLSPGTDRP